MITTHAIIIAIYLLAVGAIASTWWRTRATWTWYALAILAAPLLGALWVLTLSPARHPPASDPTEDTAPGLEEETWPDPPPPIALPHDHTTPEDHHVPPPPPPDDADHDADLEWYRERTDALRDE